MNLKYIVEGVAILVIALLIFSYITDARVQYKTKQFFIKSKDKIVSTFNKINTPIEKTSEKVLASEEDFCSRFDNCIGHSEEYRFKNDKSLELYIDTCDIEGIIPDGWKIFKLKKWFLNKEGIFTPVNYTRCHKGYDIGENINHYYCNISLSQRIVTDVGGEIIDKNLRKYIGVEYEIESSYEEGLYLLKLVEHSCT